MESIRERKSVQETLSRLVVVVQPNNALHPTPVAAVSCAFAVCCAVATVAGELGRWAANIAFAGKGAVMDEWQVMFAQMQSLTRKSQPLQQNLNQVIGFARNAPTIFDEPEYWNQAQKHDFQTAFATLTNWAKQGLEALNLESGWQFLLLDLGDCPEAFRLYSPGGQKRMSEQQFRGILSSKLIISTSDMENCFGSEVPNPFGQLIGEGRSELSDHHVSELGDSLLDWTDDGETDYHGKSGYLLWLTLGSLALIEPLWDKDYCKAILRGRDKLYLLSGYEEIFVYLATITPEGILYETA